jgi:F0F1-type ATP synthase delta subunit
MRISDEQYAKALLQAITLDGDSVEAILDRFMDILKRNNDIERLDDILEVFGRLDTSGDVGEVAHISTRFELADDLKVGIEKKLLEFVPNIQRFTYEVSEEILGGFRAEGSSFLVDATVNQHLVINK